MKLKALALKLLGGGGAALDVAEDAAHVSGDRGIMALGVRQNTAAALAGTDGDYIPLIVDTNGRLHAILSALEKAEDAAHVSGDFGVQMLAVRTDTPVARSGADGDYEPLQVAAGRLQTELRAARLAADNLALPTAPDVLAMLMGYDSATLDLLRTVQAFAGTAVAGAGLLGVGTFSRDVADGNYNQDHNPTSDTGTSVHYKGVAPVLWDETNMARQRGNSPVTAFASAARTATANSADLTNYNGRGIRLHLDITAVSGTSPTLDVTIQALIGGVYIAIASAAFAQKTATGTDELVIYPGIAETANESVSDVVPRTWRAVATIGGTTPSFTFALTAAVIL